MPKSGPKPTTNSAANERISTDNAEANTPAHLMPAYDPNHPKGRAEDQLVSLVGKPNQETWHDSPWSQPGSPEPEVLITSEELFAQLRSAGHEVSDRTLRHWQQSGTVPRPVRRWHEGRTAALYPPWMVDLIIFALSLKAGGTSLDDVREAIHRIEWGRPGTLDYSPPVTARERNARLSAYEAALDRMADAVIEVAKMQEEAFGSPILHAHVRLINARGDRWEHRVTLNTHIEAAT